MASNNIGTFDMKSREVISRITMVVRVRGMKRLRIRLWLACQVIRLASVISGVGLILETDAKPIRAGHD